MKKVFLIAIVAVSLGSSAFAKPATAVSHAVTTTFQANFPKATNVQWDLGKKFTKATFLEDDQRTEAFFSLSGEFLGTSRTINLEDLPTRVKRNFAKKYSAYIVKEAIEFKGVEEDAYYISVENSNRKVILKVVDGVLSVHRTSTK